MIKMWHGWIIPAIIAAAILGRVAWAAYSGWQAGKAQRQEQRTQRHLY